MLLDDCECFYNKRKRILRRLKISLDQSENQREYLSV